MSITIHQSPGGYSPSHDAVWHVVESDDKELAGFQYVFDIYKGTELLTRVKNAPYGVDKYGVLDVGNIVRSALESNFPTLTIGDFTDETTLGADVFFTEYDIRYGQVVGVGEVSGNVASGTYRVYNNYLRSEFDRKQSSIAKLSTMFTYGKILTNRPQINSYYPGEPVVMTMFVDDNLAADYTRELSIDGVSTASVSYDTSVTPNTAFAFAWIPTGEVQNVDITVDYAGDTLPIRSFEFRKKCSKYDTHTLIFLNAFGVYDSFTFVHGKMMQTTEKKKFEQNEWSLIGTSIQDIWAGVYNEQMKTYAVEYRQKMSLTSDILTTEEYDWLSELVNSPQVYYYSTDNSTFFPVQITDTDYEFKDDKINKADTLTVNIDFSIKGNAQYR